MAKTREIKKRIKAVGNIRRITKTMQMIATSKFAKAQQRAVATKPYTEGVFGLVTELAATAGNIEHPLITGPKAKGGKELTLVITSDRGLCGPYNGSVLRTAMVHLRASAAASGGARRTVTVDASPRYLRWAEENLLLNGLAGDHAFVAEDARGFLERARSRPERFGLCFVDPPTFSTRKDAAPFDVQRDHPALIQSALELVEPGGVLYFSTSHQRFAPRLSALPAREVREITGETAPRDYRRTPHRCFRFIK